MSALQDIAVDLVAERAGAAAERQFATTGGPRATGLSGWLAELSVGNKIRVFYFGNLGFALMAGVFIILAQFQLADRAEKTALEHEFALDAQALVSVMSEAQRHAEALVTTSQEARRTAAAQRLDTATRLTGQLREKVRTQDIAAADRIAKIEAGVDDFRRQVAAFDTREDNAARRQAQASDVRATGSLVLEAAQDIARRLRADASAMSDDSADFINLVTIIWIITSGILTVLTLIAMRYFDRNVGSVLKTITDEMTKLAAGKDNITVSGQERRDEIGEMARAMEVFHHAGRRLERLSRERAQRARAELDEKTQLQARQEEDRHERERMLTGVADQFERGMGDVLSGVAEAASQLKSTSQLMAGTADQASARVADLGAAMEEARAGATAAAAASDEFAMSIGEISQQAASSAQLARRATDTVTSADTTISALSDSAQQVGQIVQLIQTIAQRTNLLALNASIEAARGGEAGRGFAVVASEVKELANQTSRATEQIAEQIRAMQDTTGASVGALRSIAEQVQQLEGTAVSIACAVDQQSVAGQELARSIDLAARGTEKVADHLDDVHELSVSTGSAAAQVLASASNLEQQAAELRGQANAFLAKVRVS
jgi:methyl-accepting chemotaxis protein